MKSYTVSRNSHEKMSISGETLAQAIENSFKSIAKMAGIGNVAGFELNKVWVDFPSSNSEGVLHIRANGSDDLMEYDPIADQPRETVLYLTQVPEAERVSFEIELRDNRDLDRPHIELFSDDWIKEDRPEYTFGVFCAIVDEISDNHCRINSGKSVTKMICLQYPNLADIDLQKFIKYALKCLNACYPNDDAVTNRLLLRAQELAAKLEDVTRLQKSGHAILGYHHANFYFDTTNAVTALAAYRERVPLTQSELAEKVGISPRQIRNYESLHSTLGDAKYSVVEKIAEAVQTTPDKLVRNGIAIRLRRSQR